MGKAVHYSSSTIFKKSQILTIVMKALQRSTHSV